MNAPFGLSPILNSVSKTTGEPLRNLSDNQLHARFRDIGRVHKELKRALMGMLGELDRRGIPRRAGYTSLFEYAEREGGLDRAQIELALRLDRGLAGLEHLRKLFEQGHAFPNRLRVVLGIACPDLDEELADLVQRLSKAELEVWVRDWKEKQRQKAWAAPATPDSVQRSPGQTPTGQVPIRQPLIPTPAHESTPVPGLHSPPVLAPSLAAAGGPPSVPDSMPFPATSFMAPAAPAPVPGPAQALGTTPAESRTDSPAPFPLSSPAIAAPQTMVWIQISVIHHQRLLREQARLSGVRGRAVSLNEVLSHLLTGEDTSRSRYIPVITTAPDGAVLALRTPGGDVPLTGEDLAGLRPACPPIDLEKEQIHIQPRRTEGSAPSRTRPAAVERYLHARSGGACEADGCAQVGMVVHHWRPWRTDRLHDPAEMSVLCTGHAALADRGLLVRDVDGRTQVLTTPPQGKEARVRAVQDRFEEERELALQRKAQKKLPSPRCDPPPGGGGSSVPGRPTYEDDPGELIRELRGAQEEDRCVTSTSAG